MNALHSLRAVVPKLRLDLLLLLVVSDRCDLLLALSLLSLLFFKHLHEPFVMLDLHVFDHLLRFGYFLRGVLRLLLGGLMGFCTLLTWGVWVCEVCHVALLVLGALRLAGFFREAFDFAKRDFFAGL